MSLNFPIPVPAGEFRKVNAFHRRQAANHTAFHRPHPPLVAGGRTQNNGEEVDYSDNYCMNFSKGLKHDAWGILEKLPHYELFVEGINRESDAAIGAPGESWFEVNVETAKTSDFTCTVNGKVPDWRGWESPRAGHAYDLQGPDAEALCMPPAPRLDSDELAVEMAEVYALALLRDVPFSQISNGKGKANSTSVTALGSAIANMAWHKSASKGTEVEKARRKKRGKVKSTHDLFRGSAPGAKDGPYISQFLLAGSDGLAALEDIHATEMNMKMSKAMVPSPEDGEIVYGTQIINQKVYVHEPDIDYMTEWHAWLDVQNGANLKNTDRFLSRRRFITTPRDLATYVHFDQLYQAYLNAALLMFSMNVPADPGFPSGARTRYPKENPNGTSALIKRDSFATFGGPHLLALLTEVSSRALRAVRRQKFNYHRRVRPEVMGWVATLAESSESARLGRAENDAKGFANQLPDEIKRAVKKRNAALLTAKATRNVKSNIADPDWVSRNNLLLPMAFPEGSPMHPSYGAGHATVAGACVTILKAFFQLRDAKKKPIPYLDFAKDVYEANDASRHKDALTANQKVWGKTLKALKAKDILNSNGKPVALTIEGELNKLAANIAIGRNMAGVHYYTDYYDSLRLGERIAIGILQEQMTNYPDNVTMTLWDYDGHEVEISGGSDMSAAIKVCNLPMTDTWWNCHPFKCNGEK